jgi:predicted ArsR family transcriptional regulator
VRHRRQMDDDVATVIAAFDDPTRRALYRYVADADHDVSRDEAATAVGAPRGRSAFHLDKLADSGLLSTVFRRLNERSGPGAGRPAKLYRRSGLAPDVSIPPRRYMLAGEILTSALDMLQAPAAEAAVRDAARAQGRHAVAADGAASLSAQSLDSTLAALGYEPEAEAGGDIALRNCPFRALVLRSEQRTCAMNQAFLEGVLIGLGDSEHRAELAPEPGFCCVRVVRTHPVGRSPRSDARRGPAPQSGSVG